MKKVYYEKEFNKMHEHLLTAVDLIEDKHIRHQTAARITSRLYPLWELIQNLGKQVEKNKKTTKLRK